MNCFQRKEARVNVLSLKLTESALPRSRERKENGNTMEVNPCWEGLWNGEECAMGTPASCRDVRNALRGRLNHHKSHLLFTIEEDLLQLIQQLTSRTERKKVSIQLPIPLFIVTYSCYRPRYLTPVCWLIPLSNEQIYLTSQYLCNLFQIKILFRGKGYAANYIKAMGEAQH